MSDTVLTLSSDGQKMTGMGGWPSNLQTVVRMGGSAAAASDVPGEADALVIAARASEQYCTYADQMKAAGNYGNAAAAFAKEGNRAKQRWAMAQMKRASANADRCDKPARSRGPSSASTTRQEDVPADCGRAIAYMNELQGRGENVGVIRLRVMAQGCQVPPDLAQSKAEKVRNCIRLGDVLRAEKKRASEITAIKKQVGC